jgi:hydrogen peroxide-dependent heme synthase
MDDLTFAFYPVFAGTPDLADRPADDLEQLAHEAEILLKEWSDRVAVRGVYSTIGFRPDAELMMWWVGHTPDDLQDLMVAFRRSALGRRLDLTWSFMGLVRPAEFAPDHVPAFVKGEPARRYLSVYPFVRTPEWYLLPAEERGALLREHGEIGRLFPEVLANTTSTFGLSDWEWILAFESDDLAKLVECIRALRGSRSRLYVKHEIPFVTGIRKELTDAVRSLGGSEG